MVQIIQGITIIDRLSFAGAEVSRKLVGDIESCYV